MGQISPLFVLEMPVDTIVEAVEMNCNLVAGDGQKFDQSELEALGARARFAKGRQKLGGF